MAYSAKKTEHAGAKNGAGAFYGPRRWAKKESSRTRRVNARRDLMNEQADVPDCTFSYPIVQAITLPPGYIVGYTAGHTAGHTAGYTAGYTAY